MRILLVAHNVVYGDGQGRINLEIARRALARGHQVRIASVEIDPEILKLGATCDRIVIRRRPVLARIMQFARAADRLVDQHAAERNNLAIIANGFTLTRPHDLNLCQFVHAAWLNVEAGRTARNVVDSVYQQLYTRYNANRERAAYAAARQIVTPSHRTAAELQEIGVPASKIDVIPNGVDPEEFHPGPADRTSLGLAENVPLLLFTGDLRTNRKGLKWLLQAVAQLPAVHLAVVGRLDGSIFPAMAQSLGIAGRIHFLGFRRDVAAIMRACDLFVFPSAYDPFGMVVTEALASGLPVVTAATTGASELVTPACGTVLEDSADVTGLVRAISDWIAPAHAAAARDECRRVAQQHTWNHMADAYLDRLMSLVPQTPAAAPMMAAMR